MNINKIKKCTLFFSLVSLGIILRFLVMSLGHNFDFDSYCIVGEISGNLRNVYAETDRYNYAPAFFIIQGILYRVSQIDPDNWVLIYRILIVTMLTAADLGITAYIAVNHSYFYALLFFLNPVSVIITGYHNQFDNIAVLFALLSIPYFNDEKEFNKNDIAFVVWFSLSLIIKHILFLLPVFILLMDRLPIRKKLLYAFVPPMFFLISFIPFALSGNDALHGIIWNVFRYRSSNNAPFYSIIFNLVGFPQGHRIIIYGIMMMVVAWIVRKMPFENILMIYLIAMVTFSSAVADQYLAIPMAALCIMNVGIWDRIYMAVTGFFLALEEGGLSFLRNTGVLSSESLLETIGDLWIRGVQYSLYGSFSSRSYTFYVFNGKVVNF